jgi:RimJ/RimL family protein N-acetyltransferase
VNVVTPEHASTGSAPFDARIRPLDLDADLSELHEWFNAAHARFWGLQGRTRADVAAIYAALVKRPGFKVLVGTLRDNGARAFLLETYCPERDELGDYYHVQPGDRGCHFFMAPNQSPRHDFTYHALGAIAHHVFSDPAVQRLVAEPDIRNKKALTRLLQRGYRSGGVLHLPNKTAQLMVLERRHFEAASRPTPPLRPRLRLHAARAHCHILVGRVVRELRSRNRL